MKSGRICGTIKYHKTGGFIPDERREQIIRKFAPLSVDMETAAVAHVCYVNRIPFLAVRSITDTAAHSGIGAFEENCVAASGIAAALTAEVIKESSSEAGKMFGNRNDYGRLLND